jgi:hypothetical protein
MDPTRRGLRSDVVTGGRLALRALLLLRRHPVLLLLPVVIAVFNAAESAVGAYIAGPPANHTVRQLAEALRPLFDTGRYALLRACSVLASPATTTHLGSGFVGLVLLLLLSAALTAGYYAVIRGVIEAGAVQWGRFWPGVRHYAARLLLYYLLLTAVSAPSTMLSFWEGYRAATGGRVSAAYLLASLLVDPLLVLSLALMPMGVVMADLPFLRAVGRSVVTIWGRVGTTAVLVLGTMVVSAAVTLPYWVASDAVKASRYGHSATGGLIALPLDAIYKAAIAATSVWALLALFLWYREAYPAPVAPPPEEAPPAVA